MVGWDAIDRVRDTVRQESRWSSFPGTELIVMFIVVVGAVELAPLLLGMKNVVIVTVFAVAWLRPAVARLLDLRRGHYLPWKHCASRRFEAAALLIGGIAPWAILPLLHELDPAWVARLELPVWVRACGAALAIVMLAKQRIPTRANQDSSSRVRLLPSVTLDSQLMIVSMLMMSGSGFIALLATGLVLSACVSSSADRLRAACRFLEGSRLTAVPFGFHHSDLIGCEMRAEVTTANALTVTEG